MFHLHSAHKQVLFVQLCEQIILSDVAFVDVVPQQVTLLHVSLVLAK